MVPESERHGSMTRYDELEYLDFVKFNQQLYCVIEIKPDYPHKGMIGIADRDYACKELCTVDDPDKLSWLPVQKAEKLEPVSVNQEILRSFFRLEHSAWELASKGLFPFDESSAPYQVTKDDMIQMLKRFPEMDEVTRTALWKLADHQVLYRSSKTDELEKLFYSNMCDVMAFFDPEEADPNITRDLAKWISANINCTPSNAVIPEDFAQYVCRFIHNEAVAHPVSDGLRALYIRLLDTPTRHSEEWRLYERGYAYYGGNKVVPCDWEKSAESLLAYYALHTDDQAEIANSLGYIYASDRLGKPDYEQAFRYFEEAAQNGSTEATYKLSDLYRKGLGTRPDHDKALALLKPVYEHELTLHRKGHYGSNLADIALRMGYCARDGIGRDVCLRDAYCLFMQAKNAIAVRRIKYDHFGDGTVENNIDRALAELSRVYSPSNENYAGLIGYLPESRALFRCISDDGHQLILKSISDDVKEAKYPKDDFTPITEHSRTAGDTVTILKGQKAAVVSRVIWHTNRGTLSYLLKIDGRESNKWYFEWELVPNQTPLYEMKFMFDWGSGTCLWSANDAAIERYNYPVDLLKLPLSGELLKRLEVLVNRHDEALDWDDPAGDLLWNEDQQKEFTKEALKAYREVCLELGPKYHIVTFKSMI